MLFDTVMSMLGLLNPNIYAENFGLKFGFLTMIQMLKSFLNSGVTPQQQG